ncbi:Ldh family oxidoreductase [Desulfovibrio desulfuricans]|uniref:Ldh family oxidoreductase n=2 Tax=Desulfovibrio desulfuricans TaxID=876 RepID=A0A4P7UKL6_DESDE|nr:Ldh family oxidoreductase [Desulfovibrio desulfuricans]
MQKVLVQCKQPYVKTARIGDNMSAVSLTEAQSLGENILKAHNVGQRNAELTIASLLRAEMEGLPSHGFSRIPYYAAQSAAGKVDGHAVPVVQRPKPGVVTVDACCGFAFSAFADGLPVAAQAAKEEGVALLAVRNSHHAGVLGFPVADLAEQGLVALGFANSPAALAPYGGTVVTFGTNPLAMACPRKDAPPLVIDLSMGLLARGKILQAAKKGELIPEGAAVDAQGNPTRDPVKAFEGALLPFGGPKGYALALMVEIMAAGLTGASLAIESSSLFTPDGPPPRLGQSFVLMDPAATAGANFVDRVEHLLAFITGQPGARLPGDRRIGLSQSARQSNSIDLPDDLLAQLRGMC